MAEYIEKEKFIKWVDDTYCKPCEEAKRDYNHCRCGSCQYDDMMCDVESFESADVAPVRHGRWTDKRTIEHDGEWYCSACNKEITIYMGPERPDRYRYCPNCGAKMDGGET